MLVIFLTVTLSNVTFVVYIWGRKCWVGTEVLHQSAQQQQTSRQHQM